MRDEFIPLRCWTLPLRLYPRVFPAASHFAIHWLGKAWGLPTQFPPTPGQEEGGEAKYITDWKRV